MADTIGRRGLGRGLSALLNEGSTAPASPGGSDASLTLAVATELLRRNPSQPRRDFPEAELDELAASLVEHGVLQPILVRPVPNAPGEYQIVAGERRWRAAQRANLKTVPVLIRELDDSAIAEISIVENVQRSDLNALEEAAGYRQLLDKFGRTQEAVAKVVGKSRSHVANSLRLLNLPAEVREHLRTGRLSAGHARAIATAHEPEKLAGRIVAGDLSVRQAEQLAKGPESKPKTPASKERLRKGNLAVSKHADTHALEQDLSTILGLNVEIIDSKGKGELRIRYDSLDQLDEVCRRLSSQEA